MNAFVFNSSSRVATNPGEVAQELWAGGGCPVSQDALAASPNEGGKAVLLQISRVLGKSLPFRLILLQPHFCAVTYFKSAYLNASPVASLPLCSICNCGINSIRVSHRMLGPETGLGNRAQPLFTAESREGWGGGWSNGYKHIILFLPLCFLILVKEQDLHSLFLLRIQPQSSQWTF